MDILTNDQLNDLSVKQLADYGYELARKVKHMDDALKLVKDRFKDIAKATDTTEFMGEKSKVIIQGQTNMDVNPRALLRELKAGRGKEGEALFWALVKVGVTEARKAAPAELEKVATTSFDPYYKVLFK